MNYTNVTLLFVGLVGVLLHNLVELNKLNKSLKGNVKLGEYIKLEKYSILISIIMVCGAVVIKSEITQLEAAGKWLGFAFAAIGYSGQSLLVFLMGRANRVINYSQEAESTKTLESKDDGEQS